MHFERKECVEVDFQEENEQFYARQAELDDSKRKLEEEQKQAQQVNFILNKAQNILKSNF